MPPSSNRPFHELLGIQLRGATQTIGADAAADDVAELLGVPPGSPVLRCQRITTDTTGRPVLLSEHLFSGHRTEFVVELPQAAPSTTPSGVAPRRVTASVDVDVDVRPTPIRGVTRRRIRRW